METQYVSDVEAAKLLGVSVAWLRQARYLNRTDAPPFHRFGGRTIRYSVAELMAWADAQRVEVGSGSDE